MKGWLLLRDLLAFQRDFAAAIDASSEGALAVYRNTVVHGAVEALRSNFPVVEQMVGAEMFEALAVDYAAECPPRQPVLALYGARLADWLEEQPWIGDLGYLPDVARVERLHIECLMAADGVSLPDEKVRETCRRPGARFELHPAVRFAWLPTPAMSIWLAHQRPIDGDLNVDWKAEGALFVRPTPWTVHAPRIGRAAHRLLFGIRLGESVDAAMGAATRLYPDEDCTAVFASLVNLGAFVAPPSERYN